MSLHVSLHVNSGVVTRILAKAASEPHRVRVQTFAFEPKTPPSEIQLWSAGDNPTDYGIHKWTERSAADVFARYESRGNPLLIDVEHNGANTADEEPTVTGGYARLELRAGAPWLVFDWSAYGVEQIATGQRRFLSPEYDVDRATGEILALYRVSLVADPGTHRARMLAAAALKQETGMDPKLAAIMAILSSVADPAAAVDAIKSLVANLDGGDAAPPADEMAAAGDPPGDKPGPAGDGPPEDKEKVAAAAPVVPVAPVAAAQVVAPAAPVAPSTTHVTAAADAAVLQINNAQRDHLILTEGDRLEPSIRRWASSQPLAVVRGLIGAAPGKLDPPGRAKATRGDTQGQDAQATGLEGEALERLQKQMGTFKTSAQEVHETPAGVLVLPSVPPSVLRERKRVAAAAAIAGKAGT